MWYTTLPSFTKKITTAATIIKRIRARPNRDFFLAGTIGVDVGVGVCSMMFIILNE